MGQALTVQVRERGIGINLVRYGMEPAISSDVDWKGKLPQPIQVREQASATSTVIRRKR
jgi:hypothetical protein